MVDGILLVYPWPLHLIFVNTYPFKRSQGPE